MVVKKSTDVTEEEIADRITARLVADEMTRIREEQRQAEIVAAQHRAALRDETSRAEEDAKQRLEALKPYYERRNQAAQEVAEALARFYENEVKIRGVMTEVEADLKPLWRTLYPVYQQTDRLANIRERAGLAYHGALPGIPENTAGDLAYTALSLIISGALKPGAVKAGYLTATVARRS